MNSNEIENREVLNIAGGYHKISLGKDRRLRYNWGVSNKWLERCKPDLTGLSTQEDDPQDGSEKDATQAIDIKSEITGRNLTTLSLGHHEEVLADLDEHCEVGVKDKSFSESDPSEDVPSIVTFSQEQKWNELIVAKTSTNVVKPQLEAPAKSAVASSVFDIIDSPMSLHDQPSEPSECEVKLGKLNATPLSSESFIQQKKSLPKTKSFHSSTSNRLMMENYVTNSSRWTLNSSSHRSDNNFSTVCNSSASSSLLNKGSTSPLLRNSTPTSGTTKPESEDDVQSDNESTEELKDRENASSESVPAKDTSVAKGSRSR